MAMIDRGIRDRARLLRTSTNDAAEPRGAYDRETDLPRLLPLFADDLRDGADRQARLLALLRRALRAERTRGRAGHWTYDVGRHAALLRALRCEEGRASVPRQANATASISVQSRS